ncbi:chlorohydrolase [Streptococcus pneumoniae]|nr:chlorohydrolase [Streptococcus pneumoniae]
MSSKHCFEVVDKTDKVSSKHRFEVADRTDEVAQNTVLRLQMKVKPPF